MAGTLRLPVATADINEIKTAMLTFDQLVRTASARRVPLNRLERDIDLGSMQSSLASCKTYSGRALRPIKKTFDRDHQWFSRRSPSLRQNGSTATAPASPDPGSVQFSASV